MSVVFVCTKTHAGKIKALRGIAGLDGEDDNSLHERAKATLAEGESLSAVYGRFKGIPGGLLASAMKTASELKLSQQQACDRFAIAARYIPAWQSKARANGVTADLGAIGAGGASEYDTGEAPAPEATAKK